MPVSADRVILTSGTSEGIELALGALADAGDEVLVPTPTYPLYTAVLAKIGARAVYYRTDPSNHWLPDLDDVKRLISGATRALVVIDPNNPTGAVYPESTRRALIDLAAGRACPSSPTRSTATSGSTVPGRCSAASSRTRRSCRSRRSRRRIWHQAGARAGSSWAAPIAWTRRSMRSRSSPTAGCAVPGPMQYGIEAALRGDRTHQREFVRDLSSARI